MYTEKIYIFYIVAGFLSGSILFGYLFPLWLKGIDVRELSEDGNPGTFNAFACGGIGCGILTLAAELGKGILPVAMCLRKAGPDSFLFAFVMAAPVVGHAYSVFHKGRGGKAIAVSFGVLIGLLPFWKPLVFLIGYYLLFSLLIPVKSHGKRTVRTFLCFAVNCAVSFGQSAVTLGCALIAATVIRKHSVELPIPYKNREGWRIQ